MKTTTQKAHRLVRTVKTLSSTNIAKHLDELGWPRIRFTDEQDEFFQKTHTVEFATGKDAFVICKPDVRAVCVRADKPEKETVILLLHELGHILLGHNLLAISAEDELEATLFVNQCIQYSRFSWSQVLAAAVLTASLPVVGFLIGSYQEPLDAPSQLVDTSQRQVILTQSGAKYHLETCSYLSDKTDTTTTTRKEAEAKGYDPCKVCRPELQ